MSSNLLQQKNGKKVNTVVDAVVNAVSNMAQQLIT